MTQSLSAHIISIGTEILLGEIVDTNSAFLAQCMRDIGVNVHYMSSVGDNVQRIEQTISRALDEAQIVITCGGLGPTVDDMTRQSVANATHRPLVFDDSLLTDIKARFERLGANMTENNRRQAHIPENATIIRNPVGTAPSFAVETGDRVVICLPGVPREMKYLMRESVVPYLKERYQIQDNVILSRTLKTAGIGESHLDTLLGEELLNSTNPSIGLAAHSGQIDIRITAKANTRAEATEQIQVLAEQVYSRVGHYIFGENDTTLEEAIGTMLASQNATLTLTELGTDNAIYQRLSDNSGQSEAIYSTPIETPATITYNANALKALAEETTRDRLAQHTLHIMIISNPNIAEHGDDTVATLAYVATKEKAHHRMYGFGAQSEHLQKFAGNWSLSVAWRLLRELDSELLA